MWAFPENEQWKRFAEPYSIADILTVVPAWCDVPQQCCEHTITIDSQQSFGLLHPSTRLCLEILTNLVYRATRFLDVGCGSGLLTVASLRLGASRASVVDIDPDAVRCCLHNASVNGVVDRVDVLPPDAQWPIKAHDLVIANLGGALVFETLEAKLFDAVALDGILVAGGLLDVNVAPAMEIFQRWSHTETVQQEGWNALLLFP